MLRSSDVPIPRPVLGALTGGLGLRRGTRHIHLTESHGQGVLQSSVSGLQSLLDGGLRS